MVASSWPTMGPQYFKSIYFPDLNRNGNVQTFKLALGSDDDPLARAVRGLSSCEMRSLLGFQMLNELKAAAVSEGLPVNRYCLRVLKKRLPLPGYGKAQAVLPGFESDPSYTGFRSDKKLPLHRWYPYIQCYSPEFVVEVLNRHAPAAKRVLDPFAGVGTTPITVARLGVTGFYCELNPLLQFLTDAKIQALALSAHERKRTADRLKALSVDF